MAPVSAPISPDSFTSFGELLKYLRRHEQLTQLELSIKVGYSEAQISRLEKNQRVPDPTGIKALFIPALHLEENPQFATRLVKLAQSARQVDAPLPGLAPYKGLLYFDKPDAELFFGRQALTSQLAKHVMDLSLDVFTRFLAVVGASGSGKSSVVRAGLAVALKRVGWEVLLFTPTSHPMQILETRLSSIYNEDAQRVLVLVDQFEEVFTLCHDEMERITFFEKLIACAQEKSKKYSVVIALRADFYYHCAQYPLLRQVLAAEQEYIGQMTFDELRQAIEEPARRNGWEFEPGLVDVILRDLSAHGSHLPEPGALPLLSHALLATWEHRHGRLLTLEGYHASGGVRGAIAETAESVFTDQLDQKQQEIARDVFLRLTELGQGTEDTRRRAALAELGRQFEEMAQFRAVLNILAEKRLITLNEDSAEVAHEALIREWRRLHEWLTQDREGLLLHRHLTEAAQEWEHRGRDVAELYRGARLAQADEWATANTNRLNQSEHDFLAASIDREQHEALEREAQRQRELEAAQSLVEAERERAEDHKQAAQRLRRRAWQLAGVLALALALAAVAILFARQASLNYQSSQLQARLATARGLASAAKDNIEINQDRSLLLAMQAVKTADIPESENALHRAILAKRLRDTLVGHAEPVYGVAFTPGSLNEATRLATASQDGTIKIWELDQSGENIKGIPLITIVNPIDFEPSLSASGNTLCFSPDGKQLAAISHRNTAKIWDAATGVLLSTLVGHQDYIVAIDYSPDGMLLVTAGNDNTYRIWDSHSGKELQTLTGFTKKPGAVAFSSDGKRLVTAEYYGQNVIAWDRIDDPKTPGSFYHFTQSFTIQIQMPGVTFLAFNPDGTDLAIGFNKIMVYDIASATLTSPARLLLNFPAHQNAVNGLFYSRDGKFIISGSADGTAKVWDAHTGQLLFTLPGSNGPLTSMTLSRDGNRLYTVHTNGSVNVWDISITGNQEWLTIPEMKTGFYTRSDDRLINVIPDNNGSSKFTVMKVSPAGAIEVLSLNLGNRSVNAFDADQALSRVAFIYAYDNVVHVWNLPAGQELISFSIAQTQSKSGHTTQDIYTIKISSDGSRIATGDDTGAVFIWDVQTGEQLHELIGHTSSFNGWDAIDYSLDGRLIATANTDGSVRIWDASTGVLLHNLPGHKGVYPNLSFSKDGKYLLATGKETTVNLWDVQTGQALLTIPDLPIYVDNLTISPDGKYLAVARLDGIVNVWEASTGQELLSLPGFYVRFTADGKHLLTWTNVDNILHGYLLDINELMNLARTRLTRTWTQEECSTFLHTEVCPPTP